MAEAHSGTEADPSDMPVGRLVMLRQGRADKEDYALPLGGAGWLVTRVQIRTGLLRLS